LKQKEEKKLRSPNRQDVTDMRYGTCFVSDPESKRMEGNGTIKVATQDCGALNCFWSLFKKENSKS
jgi:hypothetical protein